jgi:hypothetical protein
MPELEYIEKLDCGHRESGHDQYTRGYAILPDDTKICYDCAHERDLEHIKTEDWFYGYIDSSFQHIVNWPGKPLMRVLWKKRIPLPFQQTWSWISGNKYYSVRAIDNQGCEWYGRCHGEGTFISLKKAKGKSK